MELILEDFTIDVERTERALLVTLMPAHRPCGSCGQSIPAARLLAMPNAVQCVPCLRSAGDVPLVRRIDETVGDNEQVSTFITNRDHVHMYMDRTSRDLGDTDRTVLQGDLGNSRYFFNGNSEEDLISNVLQLETLNLRGLELSKGEVEEGDEQL